VWAPDSSRLYFAAEDKGESPIYVVDLKGGPVREVTRGYNDNLTTTPDGAALVFNRMSIRFPNEIYSLPVASAGKGSQAQPLTRINQAVLSQVHMSPLEPFWFRGAEGVRVHGFLLKPPAFEAGKRYPLKFLIHGGPQGAWGDDWTYRWNAQLFAASGYVVVMINFRGSTGYGQRFIDQINADWGGRAYQDLMLGLDYVVRRYPFIDGKRACALGASFGGYMVNWIIGHNNRFQCAVSHDGIMNNESDYGTTEELWFAEWEMHGPPWANRLLYQRWSPHIFAANFRTPTLVVHGQLDYRVDVSEGFQLFTTLQRLKVPSKMLYFPDEGHWVLKPQNSRLWYQTVNGWVDQWLKP
jgi:dipeptidyl aminopeptidase/acylaminoacyl peptidase